MTVRALAHAGHTVYAGIRDRPVATRPPSPTPRLRGGAGCGPPHRRARRRRPGLRRRAIARVDSRRPDGSTSSSTTPGTELARGSRRHARLRHNVVNRASPHLRAQHGLVCGSARRARAGARRPISRRTSRPRRGRTRWPSATPPSWPGSASTPRSSCPGRSPAGPTTSPTPATPPTRTWPRPTRTRYAGLMDQSRRARRARATGRRPAPGRRRDRRRRECRQGEPAVPGPRRPGRRRRADRVPGGRQDPLGLLSPDRSAGPAGTGAQPCAGLTAGSAHASPINSPDR